MADGPNQYNPMQVNMGLFPQSAGPAVMATPTPGETSMRLMEQATQRTTQAFQTIQATPLSAAQAYATQYQQRFQMAQSLQSISPFQAQMLSGMVGMGQQQGPGGGPSYLPSPLMMTPAQTGVFRPPMPSPTMPIPPMYTPPIVPMPFQPQIPRPMFQSAGDQRALTQDLQSNRMFSYGMQAPAAAGQALGIGAGAMVGARLLGGLGPMGGLAGAIGGGLLASRSGISETIGDFAQLPFKPMIETRQMGAAVQRMSQDWVISGPQLHGMGRGLTQQASTGLAGGMRDLASDSGFKEQTGGMFNRQDLMRMTQLSGQAGLMDTAQSVPAIKAQLREVANTVKRFMELTNDPDVTNVIREMGQMRQFGMTMPQISQAAENMRQFSRAAGTSIQGLRNAGGMPGASVYQGMGLTAGLGFDYGNYSMMQSRQAVAGGAIDPRQLALLGGVQGMAQRNMQAQAAFTSMPMFAAANAQFGAGGWGANGQPGAMGGGQGAFGMVNAAVANIGRGVQRGGLGALVSFPLQQQEVADAAASKMTPMEQTAQRFRMARETGERFRMKGMDALNFGARLMYGDEVASQMSIEARDPNMWESQRKMYRQQSSELAQSQRAQLEDASPGIFGRIGQRVGPGDLGISRAFRDLTDTGTGAALSDMGSRIGDYFGTPEGVSRYRARRGTSMTREQSLANRGENFDKYGVRAAANKDTGMSPGDRWSQFRNYYGAGNEGDEGAADVFMSTVGFALPFTDNFLKSYIGMAKFGDPSLRGSGKGDPVAGKGVAQAIASHNQEMLKMNRVLDVSRAQTGDIKATAGAATPLGKLLPKGFGMAGASDIIDAAGRNLANKAKDYIFIPDRMGSKQYRESLVEALATANIPNPEKVVSQLSESELNSVFSQQAIRARTESPQAAKVLDVDSYGGNRTDLMDQVNQATEKAQDKAASVTLGVADILYGKGATALRKGFFGGDTSRTAEAKEWMKGVSSLDAAVTAAVSTGKSEDMAKARKMFMAQPGATDMGWLEAKDRANKALSGMSEDVKDVMKDLGKTGDYANIEKFSQSVKYEGVTRAIHSSAFLEDFAKFGSGVGKAWRGEEGAGSVGSIKDLASIMSDSEIDQMMKTGTREQKEKAKLLKGAKKGDKVSEEKLMTWAGRVGGEEVEDVATTAASGPAARAADASAESAGEMALVASEFLPAVKDFKSAAKMLLDAATTNQQNIMQGRTSGS